ncbi:MAG: ABC transporter ATP-binding protein [Euryarchaeota archaeon]|nr:ABC transporter ATP-binding protein [Euryarchaeota archaeon]
MNEKGYKFFFKRFVKPRIPTMVFILVLSIVTMLFSFISPLLTKSLVDDVFIGKKIGFFGYILVGIVAIYIISSISGYMSSYVTGKLEFILFKNVAEDSFNVIQYASLKNVQKIKTGDMISRIMGNIEMAVHIPVHIVPQFIMSMASITVPFIIMIYLNMQLALIVISPVFLFLLSSLFFGKKLEYAQMALLKENASIFSFLKENLYMIPVIKVFGLEMWSQTKFNEKMNNYYDKSLYYTKNSSLSSSAGSLIFGVPMILLIFFGGLMVIKGSMSLGTFTAFISYVSLFFSPISQLSSLWTSYKSSLPAFDRVKEIFELETNETDDKRLIIRKGMIEFDNVWFGYNGRYILRGFNATFKKGLNYIVGDNGTGKSTVLKLLCSLYSLDEGHIKIDEQDTSRVRRKDLQKNISIIFSDPYLFDGSIHENIKIGDLSATETEIIHAAELVQVHEFIKSLPQGYETGVGESGAMLSSGEKQKISLARAILKDSPIFLLDEVTKSIDIESREAINKVIQNLKNEKTIIIVTHNINEIEPDSNIVYLEQESDEPLMEKQVIIQQT